MFPQKLYRMRRRLKAFGARIVSGAVQAVADSLCEGLERERLRQECVAPFLFVSEGVIGVAGHVKNLEAGMTVGQ